MCVKVSGEEKMCGKEEGRAGQVPTDPMVSVLESEPEQCLQACVDLETRENSSCSLWSREGLRLALQKVWFLGPHHASYPQDAAVGAGLWLSCLAFCSFAGISGRKHPSSQRKIFLTFQFCDCFFHKRRCPVFPFLLSERGMLLGLSLWDRRGEQEREAERGLCDLGWTGGWVGGLLSWIQECLSNDEGGMRLKEVTANPTCKFNRINTVFRGFPANLGWRAREVSEGWLVRGDKTVYPFILFHESFLDVWNFTWTVLFHWLYKRKIKVYWFRIRVNINMTLDRFVTWASVFSCKMGQ